MSETLTGIETIIELVLPQQALVTKCLKPLQGLKPKALASYLLDLTELQNV